MEKKYDLSIIVPIYNAEKYINNCVDSIINQTFTSYELILVNDGSTDATRELIRKYEYLENVKIIDKNNDGLSSARNTGIEASRGEYITFVDNDDQIDMHIYEKVFEIINKFTPDLIEFSVSIDFVDDGYSLEERFPNIFLAKDDSLEDNIPRLMKTGLLNYVWNKVYKASIIRENNIRFSKKAINYEDLMFNFEYFRFLSTFYHLDFIGYHYLKRKTDSMVSRYVKDNDQIFLQKESALENFIVDMKLSDNQEMIEYQKHLRVLNLEDFVINLFRVGCDLSYSEKKRLINEIVFDNVSKKVLKEFVPNHLFEKIFRLVCQTNSAFCVCNTYKMLTFLKVNCYGLFVKVRKG